MTQTIEIRPGLFEQRDVAPEEAGPLLDALAIGDAQRLKGLVTGRELMAWARSARRIPDGPLEDLWLATETALEAGGEDCDGLARVFRAGAELEGLEAAVAVLEEPEDGQWHFTVEYVDELGELQTFDPKTRPVISSTDEYGGILDSLAGIAKSVGPAVAGAALKALTGDVVGAATGLAGAALGAARGKPTAPKPAGRPVFRTPVVRGEVLPQQQLVRGFFYSVGSDGRTYRSATGKKGTWEPL